MLVNCVVPCLCRTLLCLLSYSVLLLLSASLWLPFSLCVGLGNTTCFLWLFLFFLASPFFCVSLLQSYLSPSVYTGSSVFLLPICSLSLGLLSVPVCFTVSDACPLLSISVLASALSFYTSQSKVGWNPW